MSISNEEWNAGRTRETLEAQILAFLRQNAKPFNLTDIMSGLGCNTEMKDLRSFFETLASYLVFQNALETLAREGTVKIKIIEQLHGQETYYKAV